MHYTTIPMPHNLFETGEKYRALWKIHAEFTQPHLKGRVSVIQIGQMLKSTVNSWGFNPNSWGFNPSSWGFNPSSWGFNPKVVGCFLRRLPALVWFQDTTSLAHLGCMLRWSHAHWSQVLSQQSPLSRRMLGQQTFGWHSSYMLIYAFMMMASELGLPPTQRPKAQNSSRSKSDLVLKQRSLEGYFM